MAVTRWRSLSEYHPAVRLMVRYMWDQEPPLLPSGFADAMGVPRQTVSRWLQHTGPETPPALSPQLAVRLARGMQLAVADVLTAARFCSTDDPLLDADGAWHYVLSRVRALEGEACIAHGASVTDVAEAEGGDGLAQDSATLADLLPRLEALRERDAGSHRTP